MKYTVVATLPGGQTPMVSATCEGLLDVMKLVSELTARGYTVEARLVDWGRVKFMQTARN